MQCNPLVLGVKISLRATISGTDRGSSRPALVKKVATGSTVVYLSVLLSSCCGRMMLVACYGGGGYLPGKGVAEAPLLKRAREVPDHCMWYYVVVLALGGRDLPSYPLPLCPCSSPKAALLKSSFSFRPPSPQPLLLICSRGSVYSIKGFFPGLPFSGFGFIYFWGLLSFMNTLC